MGEQQQLFHKNAHSGRLFFYAPHRNAQILRPVRRSTAEELRVTPDRCERCPEFVRRVREKSPHTFLRCAASRKCLFDALQHEVQSVPQSAHLGAGVADVHAASKITGRDLGGRLSHLIKRTEFPAYEYPRTRRDAGDEDDRHHHFNCEEPSESVLCVREWNGDNQHPAGRRRRRQDPELVRGGPFRAGRERSLLQLVVEIGDDGLKRVVASERVPSNYLTRGVPELRVCSERKSRATWALPEMEAALNGLGEGLCGQRPALDELLVYALVQEVPESSVGENPRDEQAHRHQGREDCYQPRPEGHRTSGGRRSE